jgi:hypothetical protein
MKDQTFEIGLSCPSQDLVHQRSGEASATIAGLRINIQDDRLTTVGDIGPIVGTESREWKYAADLDSSPSDNLIRITIRARDPANVFAARDCLPQIRHGPVHKVVDELGGDRTHIEKHRRPMPRHNVDITDGSRSDVKGFAHEMTC